MDFATRNLYRNAIEELGARLAAVGARDRAAACWRPPRRPPTARERDPGFHLIAEGRRSSSAPSTSTPRWRDWPSRIAFTVGARDYVAAIAFTSALVLSMPLALLQQAGIHGGMLWLLGAARRRARPSTSRWRSSTAR